MRDTGKEDIPPSLRMVEWKNGESNIKRKRIVILFLTYAALLCWYLPQIRLDWQIRNEQEETVQRYVRKENEDEKEKNESEQNQQRDEFDPELCRVIDFAELRYQNREICAWIWVPGCGLDVPVVRGMDDTYYLTHNAFGEERIYGSIFAPCDTPEDFSEKHTILYGHNMRDGTMFGGLKKYRDASVVQEYPYLYLYLPEKAWRCRVFSVEETDAESEVYRTGRWEKKEWNAWLQERKENSLAVCSGIAGKIEKVLTLSTCVGDGSTSQRLAVHAAVEEIFAIDSGREGGSVLE